MTVEHDIFGASLGRLDHVNDERAAAFGLEDLLRKSYDLQLIDIVVNQLHRLLDQAISQELCIVVRREIFHYDEVTKSLDVPVVPLGIDVGVSRGLVDRREILGCSFDHLN